MTSIEHTVLERFLRYVKIDTQSDPNSDSFPSTEKQKNLGKLLVRELRDMGIADAELDRYGYVYATLPSNSNKKVPVLCFCSHMDTSPDVTGADVKPIVHQNYQGRPIVLPDDPRQVLTMDDHPDLRHQIGNDIVTASGTTLLGADNKAGLAEIMDAVQHLIKHPEIRHGEIKILFTPDEEIGRGVDKLDLYRLKADYAYTVDGESLGSIENETFSADMATIEIEGVSAHPGFAKGKMENAIKIASGIVAALPKADRSPETTQFKAGFIHPVSIEGTVEKAKLQFILRDFDETLLKAHASVLEVAMEQVMQGFPKSKARLNIKAQYRNMKSVLDQHPELVSYAMEAMRRAGVEPRLSSIRGGTDGSRLSFMGLPCPNIFAGEHAFHSRQEWISIQDMEKAVATIVQLAMIWEEKS